MTITILSRKFALATLVASLLLWLHIPALSQNNISAVDVARIELNAPISGKSLVYIDSFHRLTAPALPTLKISDTFPKSLRTGISAAQIETPVFLQFRLRNSADTPISTYFYPGQYFDSILLYKSSGSDSHFQLLPAVYPANLKEASAFREIFLQASEEASFIVKLTFIKTSVNAVNPQIIRGYFLPVFAKNLNTPANGSHIATYFIVGILIMMVIYSLAVFILNNSIEFLYYLLFSALMAILFFLKSYLYRRSIPFNHFYESYLDFIILCVATYFYLVFIQKFVNAKTSFFFLFKVLNIVKAITIAGAIIFSICYFSSVPYPWLYGLENVTKLVWTACTVVFIVYAFSQKNKLLNYLAIGHFLYLVGIVFSLILILQPRLLNIKGPSVWGDALFYTELGLTLELICFLLALAFKNRNNLIERTRERERLKMDNERKEFEKQLAIVQAKQEERNRISTDMHDELGSGVTAIRLMSEIMRTKMQENTLPEVDKISNSANDLHSKMNTIIWTMSSSNDRLDNLVAYIRANAFELLENTHINCHFNNPEHIPAAEISGEKRRNIYLSIKETLNNMMKYSKATELWINVNIVLNNLEITVQDNGIGINKEKLREFGNGLINMKKRMENIGGTYSIENRNGTLSTFIIPL
jgi:signal transduction histidine kinase